ncbi:S-layer homology domain-containing protein [Paenibacillus sp. J5C_2022]|uniref:S-layer homology domain-containing protein n=1 Tax=Paenibacillus sp. J5C2022 TaxID=2977129 RepID=UPI0021CFBD35|nr:S-layer homology domain-containing protein [Paenibacillus sp. J5C2022]MCU6710713.1 S-layer homology domain-containing protein [Paenibacillus sp. J5C2022]
MNAQDVKLTISVERVNEEVAEEVAEMAAAKGLSLASDVVEFKLSVEANGQSLEISEYGGAYMARAIVTQEDSERLMGVWVDLDAGAFVFVPSEDAARSTGEREIVMHVPHNSLYAVIEREPVRFADMGGHWAEREVELLASYLVVQGVEDDRYAPDRMITRAEFAALLVRSLGIAMGTGDGGSSFSDVDARAWYAPVVAAAADIGLVSGVGGERFAPDARITRGQMAVMMSRAIAFIGHELPASDPDVLAPFKDRDTVPNWATDAVAALVQEGLMGGMSADRLAPEAEATRAQATVVLARFLIDAGFIAE